MVCSYYLHPVMVGDALSEPSTLLVGSTYPPEQIDLGRYTINYPSIRSSTGWMECMRSLGVVTEDWAG